MIAKDFWQTQTIGCFDFSDLVHLIFLNRHLKPESFKCPDSVKTALCARLMKSKLPVSWMTFCELLGYFSHVNPHSPLQKVWPLSSVPMWIQWQRWRARTSGFQTAYRGKLKVGTIAKCLQMRISTSWQLPLSPSGASLSLNLDYAFRVC